MFTLCKARAIGCKPDCCHDIPRLAAFIVTATVSDFNFVSRVGVEKISPSSRPTADIHQNNGVDDENEDEQQGDPSGETDYRRLIQVLLQGMGGTRMEISVQQPAGKQYAEEVDVAGAESVPEGIAKIYLVLWVAKVLGSSVIQNDFSSKESLPVRTP